MSDKNNILEKALLQVNQLEEAVKQNAQGILASTMKQELKDILLQESEEEKVETEAFESTEGQENDQENEMSDEDEETTDDEFGTDDVEGETDTDMGADDETSFDDETDMDGEEDEEDVLDMTNSPDEDVLKVFKSMKPEDGIIVKKDGDDISLEMDNDDYIIKLDGEVEDTDTDMGADDDFPSEDEETVDTDDSEGEEETIYEIDLGDDSEGDYIWFGDDNEESSNSETSSEEISEDEEVEIDEASRTFANDVRKPADQSKKFKAGRPEINESLIKENENLKKQNGLYKKTLNSIKEKLNEIALFNSNLKLATTLFTEHSTTQKEKKDILKRFDSMTTISESKNLYKTIKTELETKKPVVNESVVNNINPKTNSSSSDLLSESKAYENPQLNRMKELMGWNGK